jgi:hypothetical protein
MERSQHGAGSVSHDWTQVDTRSCAARVVQGFASLVRAFGTPVEHVVYEGCRIFACRSWADDHDFELEDPLASDLLETGVTTLLRGCGHSSTLVRAGYTAFAHQPRG